MNINRLSKAELIKKIAFLNQRVSELEARAVMQDRAREQMLLSHSRLDAILAAAAQLAIIATDPDGIITLFNSGAEKLLGYRAEQVAGKLTPMFILLESEVEARCREMSRKLGRPVKGLEVFWRMANGRGFAEREWTFIRRDGRRLVVNLIISRIRDQHGRTNGFLGLASDVTERKRVEADLARTREELERKVIERTEDLRALNESLEREIARGRRAREEHREFIDNLNIGVYSTAAGNGGRFVRANPAIAEMFGYDSVAEIKKVSIRDLYQDPRDRDLFLEELMVKGRVSNRELRLRRKDGTPFWASCTARVRRNEDGLVERIDGAMEDVSRRKRAEDALRASEERFRTLSENAPDIIYTLDRDGVFTYVNPAWTTILGRRPEEVRGRTFVDFAPPGLASYYRKEFKRIRDGKKTVYLTKPLLHKDGTERMLGMSGAPNLDGRGRVTGMVGVLKDVTESTRIARALQESERRHRSALEGAPDPVVIYDLDGRALYLNPAFAKVFGWKPRELLGRRIDFVPEDERAGTSAMIHDVLRGRDCIDFETRRLTKDGRMVDVSISAACYRGEKASPKSIIVTLRDITKRKRAAEALRKSRASLARAQAMAGLGNWEWDPATDRIQFSEEIRRIFGVNSGGPALSLEDFLDSVHREDRGLVLRGIHLALDSDVPLDLEHRIVRPDGEERVVHMLAEIERGDDGLAKTFFGAVQDITRRRRSEEQMRLLARVFENTIEGIMVTGADETIEMVNQAFCDVTGYSAEETLGRTPRMLSSGRQDRNFYKQMWSVLQDTGHWQGEIWNRRKNGEAYPEWLTITALASPQGDVSHYVGVFHDITETKRRQEQIAYQAYHDALTGLPNRLLFNDRLAMAIARAQRMNTGLVVMFLDLDHFKNVNDSLGHAVGDLLLQSVAKRLVYWLREEDTVARIGGDEFIMLLQDASDPEYAVHVAHRILESLSEPFIIRGEQLYMGASIGVAIYPHDGRDLESLVSNADIAMYRAKEEGRNLCKLFTPSMNTQVVRRLALENDLRGALARKEFLVQYQPKVDLGSGRMVGVEALVRWQRPGVGLAPPDEFIPIAEETGLIVPLGQWVLRTACRRARQWREEGYPHLQVAVNLSPRQFQQKNLVGMIRDILDEVGLPAESLELEITEGVVMQSVEDAIETLKALKKLGVHLSMDDFGRGYSSLYYLKRFPMTALKIDRSFVADITKDPDDASIVNTIISMSRSLNLKVIAEGVETADQLDFLRANSCDQMQGFLFSEPVDAERISELLAGDKRLA